ncbi:MAG: peptidoglycan DD-metalloendopeptidase family protein [Balneolaceae bacterium]
MRKSYYLKFISLVFLSGFCAFPGYGQTYEEKRAEILKEQSNTRAEINVLEARIKNYQERVSQAEARFDKSFEQYQSLNNLIALQDDKIKNLQDEQTQIEAEIQLTEQEIKLRELELKELIENYKKIILYAYKNGRTSNLELLVTSNSINQMLVRSHYLQKFEEQKAKQADQIRKHTRELDEVKKDLNNMHLKNQLVLDEIRDEKEELGSQRQQQEHTVERIKEERSTWLAEIRKSRQELDNLESTISSLISEEDQMIEAENERLQKLEEARNIADATRRADEMEKYSTPIVRENFVSEEVLLTYENAFAEAKGQLPWPVNSKTVSKKFGRIRNPLYGTITEHPGIDIVADPGTKVRSVADGYVFRIRPLPGYGDVVFVKHGSYYTAYGNLSKVDVEVGSVLKANEAIGLSGTSQSELGEVIFFLIRKGNENLNPETWLGSK